MEILIRILSHVCYWKYKVFLISFTWLFTLFTVNPIVVQAFSLYLFSMSLFYVEIERYLRLKKSKFLRNRFKCKNINRKLFSNLYITKKNDWNQIYSQISKD